MIVITSCAQRKNGERESEKGDRSLIGSTSLSGNREIKHALQKLANKIAVLEFEMEISREGKQEKMEGETDNSES